MGKEEEGKKKRGRRKRFVKSIANDTLYNAQIFMKNINFKQTQSVTYGLYCIFLCTHLEGSYPWQMDAAQTKCFCLSGFSPRNLTRMQAPRENPTPMNWWSGKRERRLSNTAAKSPVPPEGGRGAPRCKRRV